jgi:hypothetical protein
MNHEPQKPICCCGRPKVTGFFALCDRCWSRLPWSLKRPLTKLALHTLEGQAAKRAAEEWLATHPAPATAGPPLR